MFLDLSLLFLIVTVKCHEENNSNTTDAITLHPAPKDFIMNDEYPIKFQMTLSSDKI